MAVDITILPRPAQYNDWESYADALTSALFDYLNIVQTQAGIPILDNNGRLVVSEEGIYAYDAAGNTILAPNDPKLTTASYLADSVTKEKIPAGELTSTVTSNPTDTSHADLFVHTLGSVNITPVSTSSIIEVICKVEIDLQTPAAGADFDLWLEDEHGTIIQLFNTGTVPQTTRRPYCVSTFNIPLDGTEQTYTAKIQMKTGASPDYDLYDMQISARENLR
jgi:hypothetical protein